MCVFGKGRVDQETSALFGFRRKDFWLFRFIVPSASPQKLLCQTHILSHGKQTYPFPVLPLPHFFFLDVGLCDYILSVASDMVTGIYYLIKILDSQYGLPFRHSLNHSGCWEGGGVSFEMGGHVCSRGGRLHHNIPASLSFLVPPTPWFLCGFPDGMRGQARRFGMPFPCSPHHHLLLPFFFSPGLPSPISASLALRSLRRRLPGYSKRGMYGFKVGAAHVTAPGKEEGTDRQGKLEKPTIITARESGRFWIAAT